MKNRESLYPGRIKLTPVDAANGIYDLVRADEPQEEGTPLNKALLDYAVAACGVTAGTATALTLDDAFGGFALVDGAKVNFRLHVASGVNPTLNVNGTGAKALVDVFANPMPSGIAAGMWIAARYSAVFDSFVVTGIAITPEQEARWNNTLRTLISQTLASNANSIKIPFADNCTYAEISITDIALANTYIDLFFDNNYQYYTWRSQSTVVISASGGVSNEIISSGNQYYIMSSENLASESALNVKLHFSGAVVGYEVTYTGADSSNLYLIKSTGHAQLNSATGRTLNINSGGLGGAKIYVGGAISE